MSECYLGLQIELQATFSS